MTTILETILASKQREVAEAKARIPLKELERQLAGMRASVSLRSSLLARSPGVIAEIKRKSPSLGVIHESVSVADLASGYETAGASGLSVLTDSEYFGGSLADLRLARRLVSLPILRKDFVIDEYQVVEARAAGADVVLLIAAALERDRLKSLLTFSEGLGLEALVEVHTDSELDESLDLGADLVGVNNRDLSTFKISLDTCRHLAGRIPPEVVAVAESGIESPEAVRELCELGYRGFLIGGHFMKQAVPSVAAAEFIRRLRIDYE